MIRNILQQLTVKKVSKLGLEEAKTEECGKKSKISIIKENLKEFIKIFSITIGISILGLIGTLYLGKIIDNILVLLIIMNIIYFIVDILNVVIIESMETAPAIKSKHSANFIIKHIKKY